jgi:predicted HTH transcriptional regulator
MSSLNPKEVFEDSSRFMAELTAADDADIEGQYFDRKEACRPGPTGAASNGQVDDLREHVVACISAFANTNQLGGLLVVGIGKDGKVYGINHLSDQQRNKLTNVQQPLRNHAAKVKFVDCADFSGRPNKLLLVYTPFTSDAICETPENRPRSWRRNGGNNELLDDRRREQIRRDKRIVDFESSPAGQFNPVDLDDVLLREVRATWPSASVSSMSDVDLLYQLGAIERDGESYHFTKAGLLFFAISPQRVLASASIRLLRFEASVNDEDRGPPSLDRMFTGPVTKQLRDFRSVIRDSALFKVYQLRRPDGRFVEEPEFPPVAVDEAVVNAVAHRDYALSWPIECLYFRDAFVVRNPGTIIQRNAPPPSHFTLAERKLLHTPRNPKLIEWLKTMRDPSGAAFVRALSEGTRTMRDAMSKLGLPPPAYDVKESETVVTLLSEPERRLAAAQQGKEVPTTEFANLYPIQLQRSGSGAVEHQIFRDKRREFLASLQDALAAKGWFVDSVRHGLLTAHRRGDFHGHSPAVDQCVRLFGAYSFGVRDYNNKSYLCVDFTLEVKNLLTLSNLLSLLPGSMFVNRPAIGRISGWQRGRIVSLDEQWAMLRLFDFDQTERVAAVNVIPDLSVRMIEQVLKARGVAFELSREIKQRSLSASPAAARIRADRTQALIEDVARSVFPITFAGMNVVVIPKALGLARDARVSDALQVRTITEPNVEFGHHKETPDVRDGITRYGSYDVDQREIEIVPLVDVRYRQQMAALIERLRVGKYKYRGSERTFGTRFTYANILTVSSSDSAPDECRRLLDEHQHWVGDKGLGRILLIHAPEAGFSSDDVSSPYFKMKRVLLEQGLPCQMVDTPTLENPDWKDLNLALNLVAKCGVTPWVLPEGIPDADFFVGLSYTQSRGENASRLMGYANVFNEFGRWMFYSGNTQTFQYEERVQKLGELVGDTLRRLKLSPTPNIYFHYSARFSRDDRDAILAAARKVAPNGVFTFVWINTHHSVRLYDSRPETDGSLGRGSYVIGSANQVYLSTTGYNPYRKAMGTPIMLEINAHRSHPPGVPDGPLDLRALAAQVLALTKLNWSSTDSLCGEPITTKYAGDIAYLTEAFLRQGEDFKLHPVLEPTPWFI